MLNSTNMTEAGPLSMLSEDEGDSDSEQRAGNIKLPGVMKGGCGLLSGRCGLLCLGQPPFCCIPCHLQETSVLVGPGQRSE